MKKIIFYTYMPKEDISFIHAYWDVKGAIYEKQELIYTTQMAILSTELLLEGYEIWIKEPNREMYAITYDVNKDEVLCEKTNRQLRLAHNIEKMWKAGSFE